MKKAKKNCRPENPDRIPGPAGSQKILPDKTNKKNRILGFFKNNP